MVVCIPPVLRMRLVIAGCVYGCAGVGVVCGGDVWGGVVAGCTCGFEWCVGYYVCLRVCRRGGVCGRLWGWCCRRWE
jgi:hypothetical protein